MHPAKPVNAQNKTKAYQHFKTLKEKQLKGGYPIVTLFWPPRKKALPGLQPSRVFSRYII